MKNITVTVSAEIDQMARIWAAQHITTVTALVPNFLESLNLEPSPRRIIFATYFDSPFDERTKIN